MCLRVVSRHHLLSVMSNKSSSSSSSRRPFSTRFLTVNNSKKVPRTHFWSPITKSAPLNTKHKTPLSSSQQQQQQQHGLHKTYQQIQEQQKKHVTFDSTPSHDDMRQSHSQQVHNRAAGVPSSSSSSSSSCSSSRLSPSQSTPSISLTDTNPIYIQKTNQQQQQQQTALSHHPLSQTHILLEYYIFVIIREGRAC